ncbi:TolC family outer membrane protein [Caulobacter sp. UNC358MFTsu5.1]|uniref:TolC family outer membrane protein n=1 Tax=Caulobacter sp. UNC358MFTsu5.1 TaxID=1449049 RepID=UPI001E65BCB7|nr:TolC family outer membrane protein [Caulobacter sp. UNC358MFTsu5.1]
MVAARPCWMAVGGVATAALSMLAASVGPARADTLVEAITRAYQSNPTLQSQRYELRALDDAYVRAHAGLRPSAELQITGDYADNRAGDATQALRLVADPLAGRRLESNQGQAKIVIEQPLYSGGQASGAVDLAALRIRAGREALRGAEGDLILQVIAAYADVRRDLESLAVRRANLAALERQLDIVRARQEAGEVTRTDVAQAQAQLEAVRTQITLAQVQLQASRANYAALVGDGPGELAPEPQLPFLPDQLETAFDLAEADNPDLAQAKLTEQQSRRQADLAKSAGRLAVSARTSYGSTGELAPFYAQDQDVAWTASISITKPLYAGGAYQAGYHEALNRNGADRLRLEAARRQVIQNVLSAWNQAAAGRANIKVQLAQVAAAQIAFDGMSEEFRVGQRSTLDVLVAEQNLREAQLALLGSRRDAYVAEAALLRQTGRLELRALTQGAPLYDPSAHLRAVKSDGAVPWEGLVGVVDRAFASKAGSVSLEQPPAPVGPPVLVEGSANGPADRPLGEHSRTTPIPGTVGYER